MYKHQRVIIYSVNTLSFTTRGTERKIRQCLPNRCLNPQQTLPAVSIAASTLRKFDFRVISESRTRLANERSRSGSSAQPTALYNGAAMLGVTHSLHCVSEVNVFTKTPHLPLQVHDS
ncbi:hypothetical protein FHG87_009876 [Trinorchestia longiramus]|nr:hypothetical protein FHG87_009876 [Trinorchestia longiramus]